MPQLAAEVAALGTKFTPASISHWFNRQGYSLNKNVADQRSFDKLRMRKGAPTCAKPPITGTRNVSPACA
jgi:hypothetical protein